MTLQPQDQSTQLTKVISTKNSEALFAKLALPPEFINQWSATETDKDFAWALYTELRTRIATQPMHFMHGKENVALKSMYELFPMIRGLIQEKGRDASKTADLSVAMLNKVIRPFTAKWDGLIVDDVAMPEDQRTQFRKELDELQKDIRAFASLLACIAQQNGYIPDTESWPTDGPTNPTPNDQEQNTSIPFDIQFHPLVDTNVADKIMEAEKEAINKRRAAVANPAYRNTTNGNAELHDVAGLAISGGGIRSASFALGVVQELSRHNVLQHFDYLSTVSGGGYLGAFLSSYLNSRPAARETNTETNIGLGSNQLPLNRPNANKTLHSAQSESAPIRHIRGHSKYLLTGGLQNRLSMYVLGAFGVIANLLIFLPIVSTILLSVILFRPSAIDHEKKNPKRFFAAIANDETSVVFLISIPVLIISLAIVFSVARLIKREVIARCWLGIVALFVPLALLFVLWRLLPWGLVYAETVFRSKPINEEGRLGFSNWFTSIASLSAIIMFLQRYWALLNANPSMSKLKRGISLVVLGLFGPIFLFACLYLLAQFTLLTPLTSYSPVHVLLVLAIVPFVFGLLFLDINQSSLHPFYRRKLSEAFVIARRDLDETVVTNDTLKLSEMRKYNISGPYHLINAALNAPSSNNGAMRERGTDFFLFSQAYSGSASTGYFPTEKWEKRDSRLNLGTAMAISGAAASPVMGVVPLPSAKFLLAMFNVRLDFWLSVPGRRTIPFLWWTPGPWYLIRQAIGWVDEKSTFVNLSDGGHIENLGLYELLRRRCRYIVLIDGECDPKLQCGAFMQASRFAKLDFGIDIEINMDRFQTKQDGSAKYHFSFGKICYPGLNNNGAGSLEGRILYIKLSRTGNEPAGVEHYRLLNPDFPHQSTADQFFDEAQFEAYRCLGEHVGHDIFTFAKINAANTSPTKLQEWFEKIEEKLTDPYEN